MKGIRLPEFGHGDSEALLEQLLRKQTIQNTKKGRKAKRNSWKGGIRRGTKKLMERVIV